MPERTDGGPVVEVRDNVGYAILDRPKRLMGRSPTGRTSDRWREDAAGGSAPIRRDALAAVERPRPARHPAR